MSKGTLPIISCDSDEGCDQWVLDYYEMTVESIDGVRVTPIPFGWSTSPEADHLCPEHSRPAKPEPTYRVSGGQGHRDIARGATYEQALEIRDTFDRDCARYGLTNPRTLITPENP